MVFVGVRVIVVVRLIPVENLRVRVAKWGGIHKGMMGVDQSGGDVDASCLCPHIERSKVVE